MISECCRNGRPELDATRMRGSVRAGFTLVELLVVIGIIALLISILLPTLSRAREQANRAACLSNERQILQAITMYTNDNHQYLPGPIAASVADPQIVNVMPGATQPQMDVWNGGNFYSTRQASSLNLLQRYLGGVTNNLIWRCPSNTIMWENATPTSASTYFSGKRLGYGYMLNNTSDTTTTYPAYMFGYYGSFTNPTPAQAAEVIPQPLSQIHSVVGVAATTTTLANGTSRLVNISSGIWLISDIDGRNWDAGLSAAFGIVPSDAGTTAAKNLRPFQPGHRNGSAVPNSFVRNYGYLDGHASSLMFNEWPTNGNVQ